MTGRLVGKRVAILATDGFEQDELMSPREALLEEGATVDVIAPNEGAIRAWKHRDWGETV
jgi:protease I